MIPWVADGLKLALSVYCLVVIAFIVRTNRLP